MSFFDELGLKAAEQLETSVGPYVALASYKRLFGAEGDVRAKGVLGALRCAIALEDDGETRGAARELGRLPASPPIALGYAARLLAAGKAELAARVAESELARTQSSLAAYVLARANERASGFDQVTGWDDVARRAQAERDSAVLTRAAASFTAACFERARSEPNSELPRARLAELGEQASLVDASEEERVLLSRARLFSVSRFQRASALSNLETVARESKGPAESAALLAAAQHFDGMFCQLDSIEVDRIRAALKHADAPVRMEALLRFEAAVRMKKEARGENKTLGTPEADEVSLRGELERLGPDSPVPMGAWVIAARALSSQETALRDLGVRFIDRALGRSVGLPPLSLTQLANGILRAGAPEIAERVLLEAARHRETAALRTLAHAKRSLGYAALARGDRQKALVLLEEASALFSRARL